MLKISKLLWVAIFVIYGLMDPSAHAEAGHAGTDQIIPVMADDSRVSREFASLGNMYRVGRLIWSSTAPEEMQQWIAEQYCQDLGRGSRLPNQEEYRALARTMGWGTEREYNPDLFPGMRDRWFWSSTVCSYSNTAFYNFYGNVGLVEGIINTLRLSVRCVVPM